MREKAELLRAKPVIRPGRNATKTAAQPLARVLATDSSPRDTPIKVPRPPIDTSIKVPKPPKPPTQPLARVLYNKSSRSSQKQKLKYLDGVGAGMPTVSSNKVLFMATTSNCRRCTSSLRVWVRVRRARDVAVRVARGRDRAKGRGSGSG